MSIEQKVHVLKPVGYTPHRPHVSSHWAREVVRLRARIVEFEAMGEEGGGIAKMVIALAKRDLMTAQANLMTERGGRA